MEVPSATAVTVPPWIVATEVFELDHVTALFVAFAGCTVAVKVPVPPVSRAKVAWLKDTPETSTLAGVGSMGSSFGPQAPRRRVKPVRIRAIDFFIFILI